MRSMYYKTKTQKKRALESIKSKAFKLFGDGILTTAEYGKMVSVVNSKLKKL